MRSNRRVRIVPVRGQTLGPALGHPDLELWSRQDPKELWPFQERFVRERDKRTMLISPTGSGKTLVMCTIAAQAMRQGKTVIVAVPSLVIGGQFETKTSKKRFVVKCGKDTYSIPAGGIVLAATRFDVERDSATKTYDIVSKANDGEPKVIVCSYNGLSRALPEITNPDILLMVDEAHHVSAEEKDDSEWQVGDIVRWGLKNDLEILLATATPYRADGHPIIPPEDEDKFKHIRRTLNEHRRDGMCPDFGLHYVFYDSLDESEYVKKSKNTATKVWLGSVEHLIDAYIQTYAKIKKTRRHVLMQVPPQIREGGKAAEVADMLEEALRLKFPKINILNLASDGFGGLITEREAEYKKRRDILNENGNNLDVVISIKVMNEGADWPACAAIFWPRVPASFTLFEQGNGRCLRDKTSVPNHPSPDVSDIYLFELRIDSKNPVVNEAVYKQAIRTRCLVYGLNFRQQFRFKHSTETELPEDRAILEKVLSKIDDADGAEIMDIVREETGLDSEAAVEWALSVGILDPDEEQQNELEKEVERFRRRLSVPRDFSDFLNIPEIREMLDRMRVKKNTEFVRMISGGEMPEVERAVLAYVRNKWNLVTLNIFVKQTLGHKDAWVLEKDGEQLTDAMRAEVMAALR